MRLRIGENARVTRGFSPIRRISNFMSSQCTVIVFILQSLVTLMDITTNIQIIKKVSYPQEAPTDFGQVGVAEML